MKFHDPNDSDFHMLMHLAEAADAGMQMKSNSSQVIVTSMLSSHLLGPLFLEYEANSRQLERELKAKSQEVARQAEEMRALANENDELTQRMEV